MRTTLTLDDDLAAKLKDFARRKRLSFKDVINVLEAAQDYDLRWAGALSTPRGVTCGAGSRRAGWVC